MGNLLYGWTRKVLLSFGGLPAQGGDLDFAAPADFDQTGVYHFLDGPHRELGLRFILEWQGHDELGSVDELRLSPQPLQDSQM